MSICCLLQRGRPRRQRRSSARCRSAPRRTSRRATPSRAATQPTSFGALDGTEVRRRINVVKLFVLSGSSFEGTCAASDRAQQVTAARECARASEARAAAALAELESAAGIPQPPRRPFQLVLPNPEEFPRKNLKSD